VNGAEWSSDRERCQALQKQAENERPDWTQPWTDKRKTLLLMGPLHNIGHMLWDQLCAILPLVSTYEETGGGVAGNGPRLLFDGARQIEAIYAPYDPSLKRVPWLADMLQVHQPLCARAS
jgi:hypothetical protein